jgi:hypothetical protein
MPAAALVGMIVGSAPVLHRQRSTLHLINLFCRFFGIYSLCLPKVQFEQGKKTLYGGCRTLRHDCWLDTDFTTGGNLSCSSTVVLPLFDIYLHCPLKVQFNRRKKTPHAVRRTHRRASWLGADYTTGGSLSCSATVFFAAFFSHARQKGSLSDVKNCHRPSAALYGVPASSPPTRQPVEA